MINNILNSPITRVYRASVDHSFVRRVIIRDSGEEVYRMVAKYIDFSDRKNAVLSTTNQFNIETLPERFYRCIVNLRRVNDIRFVNKFFEAVNSKLPAGGIFIGLVETKNMRKDRIIHKYPVILNYIIYSFDYLIKRVFPKFTLTKQLYFLLTRGQNRVLTKAETLGRLYSCGFEVVEEAVIHGHFYFVVRKITEPVFDLNPTYGPLISLHRVGKGGEMIKVFKLRTMHPYAEYLQEYIFERNNLKEGGKFRDDFRISTLGRFLRKFWLDELPMAWNLLRGDIKIVGVRPLSKHYFSLYSDELKDIRTRHKPGLIPPFYVDYPKTLDEIMASELRYLKAYERHPLWTDFRYFFRAIFNVLFNKYRSS